MTGNTTQLSLKIKFGHCETEKQTGTQNIFREDRFVKFNESQRVGNRIQRLAYDNGLILM